MKPIRHLRWYVTALLFIASAINYVDRQTLSVLAPVLRDEFGMSNTDYSRVVFLFLLAYMIMQSGSGRIMDWLGTRRGFSLTIAWWSAAAMLHAAVSSVGFLGLCRFLLGLGEAGNWPGAVKAVSEWFPAKERAFAVGFFNSGSTVGATIAPPLVAWLALNWGWRTAFLATGASGFLWLALWWFFYRVPEEHPRVSAQELAHIREGRGGAVSRQIPWRELLKYRQVWGLVAARMLADPVWWFYVFWLPEYLKRERAFSLAMIGYFLWIPFLMADIGCFAGGWASGRLIRRGWPVLKARRRVMFVCAGLMLSGIPAVFTGSSYAALALISLTTLAYSAWAANILTLPADIAPNPVVASVSGISGTGAALGGMIMTLATGIVVDRFSYIPIFIAAGLMPVASACCVWALVRTPAALLFRVEEAREGIRS